MVLAAYMAGLLTLPAAFLGVWAGHTWWARKRRVQAEAEDNVIKGARLTLPPPPPPPQDEVVTLGQVRYGTNHPGKRRRLRGHRGDRNG